MRIGTIPLALLGAMLFHARPAAAGNILRRTPATSGASAGADATAAANAAAAAAAALARQQASPLGQAMNAIKAWQACQDAARAAAAAAASTVPEGLGTGGLDVQSVQGIGMPTQASGAGGHVTVDLVQNASRAIVNWTTFNVGKNTDVYFDQRAGGADAASWAVLNRIADPSGSPSRILGSIKAEGQVYVINRNGIVFGGASQVNVGTLVLSGLDLATASTDQQFRDATLSTLSFAGGAGNVVVDAGATLKADGGRILIAGQQVRNGGSLQSDDGQVLLLAGSQVAVKPSVDLSTLRGLVPSGMDPTGVVENSGMISAARGNVTLQAWTTSQNGLVTVTNGVEKNGSIVIGGAPASVTAAATVATTSFGPGSLTQILPDAGGTKAIGSAESFKSSSIQVEGDRIDVLDGARLYAPSGLISLSAAMNAPQPANTTDPTLLDTSRVYVGSGASLDVSGLTDVPVAMEQNTIAAQLRANELRDNPLVRAGTLRGRTVDFDARLGGALANGTGVANLGGYYDLIERDVAQLMTSGGTVAMNANQIVTRPGSVINLSGGNLRYLDGYVRRTVLVDSSGRRVPIENAVLGVAYVGIDGDYVATHPRWGVTETFTASLNHSAPRFEAGYTQGSAAGTLTLGTSQPRWYADLVQSGVFPLPPNPSSVGAYFILEGDVVARTTAGPNQRGQPSSSTDPILMWQQQPSGAKLSIANAGDVTISAPAPLGPGFGPDSVVDPSRLYQHVLPAKWFDGKTFGVVSISAGADPFTASASVPPDTDIAPAGTLHIASGQLINLGDYGSFTFAGKSADIEGTLLAPDGRVSISTLNNGGDSKQGLTLHLGTTGFIDVAGRLTNDSLDGLGNPLRPLNGGIVSLAGGRVLLDEGSRIDVTGGARIDASGAKLTNGNGGSITLDISKRPSPSGDTSGLTDPYLGQLVARGTLDGRALGTGGSLTINTGHDAVIGDALPAGAAPDTMLLTPDFFTRGGFASYAIQGGFSVSIPAGTVITPSAATFAAPDSAAALPSGTRIADVAVSAVLPPGLRAPMQLSLKAVGGPSTLSPPAAISIGAGAQIRMEPGSKVTLKADLLHVDGTVEAPGGTISIENSGSLAGSGIEIGDTGRLLAPGYVQTTLVGGIPVRSIQPGGTVTLAGHNGVVIDPGAIIDVSGVDGVADLPVASNLPGAGSRYQQVNVDGDAGLLSITAASGVIGGILKLAPGGPSGRGGELDLLSLVPSVAVAQKQATASGPGLWLIADSVDGSGADDLSLVTVQDAAGAINSFTNNNTLTFAGDVTLRTARSIRIVAPIFGSQIGLPSDVHLISSYVSLDGQPVLTPISPAAGGAGGSFTVTADVIDISRTVVLGCVTGLGGDCAVNGFAKATFDARGDIRLSDHDSSGNVGQNAGLLSGGEIDFKAAQVYVASRFASPGASSTRTADDPGFLVWSGTRVAIAGNGNAAPTPDSFGERLTLRAPDIEQGGVLRAPQGEIRLEGRDIDNQPAGVVNLLAGSITSASLVPDGGGAPLTVPFGSVLTGPIFAGYSQAGQSPVKSVKLDAPAVGVAPGAVIDVSGGGNIQGYTFVPGNNGSSDVLAPRTDANGQVVTDKSGNPLSAPALGPNLAAPFAIVPSLGTQPMPVGRSSDLRDPRLHVGDQIWLQGVPGLAPGFYTLLPAHYALLPGGLLVQPLNGIYAAAPGTYTRPDGAVVAAGYRTRQVLDGNGNDRRVSPAGFGQFVVMTQDVLLKYSQLTTYDFGAAARKVASDAGAAVRIPIDAGSIVLAARDSLSLHGSGRMNAFDGGLLGNLDLSGAKLAVVGPGGAAPAGYLALNEADLSAFGAGSILIGGTRSQTAQGTAVSVTASDVLVDTGGSEWSAPEILLAATSTVTVADGSRLRASGASAVDTNPLLLNGDGALLRLSSGARVGLVRSNIPQLPAGTLTIGNASLSAAGSLSLEGAGAVSFAPGLAFSTPQLDIGSSEVHLGAAAPPGATGTWLSRAQIEQLATATDLLIRGHVAIDLQGDLNLGARANGQATLPALTLDTGLLQDVDGGAVRITAGKLTLKDSGLAATGVAGSGTLSLDVDSLTLGPGAIQLAGFGALKGTAGTILLGGSGSLALDGGLSLLSASVMVAPPNPAATAAPASSVSYTVTAGGNLDIGSLASPSSPQSSFLGGSLSLQGAEVTLDTAVLLPSGSLSAKATAGSLTVGPHARLDLSGRPVDFYGQVKLAPGGIIRLDASGDLSVAAGSLLDVSGPSGGDAGSVFLTSGGNASVLGTLKASGSRGGSFSLDAGSLPSFSALDGLLAAGGFTDSIAVRLRGVGQDLRLEQGQSIAAHDVTLQSDQGQVFVAGSIGLDGDASHPAGGIVELTGGTGVVLTDSARIDARAASTEKGGYTPASGRVVIAAGPSGSVQIAGATIDITGGRSGGGEVVVRAPRLGADGIAIERLDANVIGATERVVQGLRLYDATSAGTIDATWFATPLSDAAAWLAAARVRYPNGFNGFDLAPAIVVKSDGDLAIAGNLSVGGALGAGSVGFVSRGNLDLQGVVSDGFATADRSASLLSGQSASLSFETRGDLTVEKNAMIRTGTGDIAIRTGGSLFLKDPTSVVYTAGRHAGFAPGFLGAPSNGALIGEMPVDGGSIAISAGVDIEAPITRQSTSAWLFRYGDTNWGGDAASSTVKQQTSWSVVFSNFQQAIGALGGGDVRVAAARDIRQLQVSIPTTGQLTTPIGQTAVSADLVVRGGGDLRVQAGRDLIGGLVMLGRGLGDLRAAGSVTPSDRSADIVGLRTFPSSVDQGLRRQVGLLVGLMDAEIQITAGGKVVIEGAYDPARQAQFKDNVVAGLGSAFWGYTDRTSLDATAMSGLLSYQNDPWASLDLTLGRTYEVRLGNASTALTSLNDDFARAPPALRLVSMQSSVYVEDHFAGSALLRLASAPLGTLEVLAGQNAFISRSLQLDDVAPVYTHGPLDPFSTNFSASGGVTVNLPAADVNLQKGLVPVHRNDPDPVRIYALAGSVCAQRTGSCVLDNPLNVVSVVSPKPIEVIAGKDVVRGWWQPQNNSAEDLSVLMAGRDVYQPIVLVTGVGSLLLQAGRDVVLGQGGTTVSTLLAGGAVYSLGNSSPGAGTLTDPTVGGAINQALPSGRAADIYVLAGAAPGRVDYQAFAAAYLDPANAAGVAKTYLPELRAYLTALDGAKYGPMSDAELLQAFGALSQPRRELFLDRVYFTELKETGIDYNDPKNPRYQSYTRGFRAVATLFPVDPASIPSGQGGQIVLSGKSIDTEAQASIALLAPYGGVQVGTPIVPAFFNEARYGGVITRRGGDIQIMADQNIDLFTSRVFTLQGGDITMWTSNGSITAGAGSKTSVFQKPLAYTLTRDGVIAVDAFGLQTGAGIGVLDALGNASGRPPSRLDLIAPRGEVNAGDAGIRVVGDLNIAAQVVVGVENIQASGASVGVPKVEVPNISSLTGATQVVQAASQEGSTPAAKLKNAAADLPSIITVEVVGYETTDTAPSEKKDKKNAH